MTGLSAGWQFAPPLAAFEPDAWGSALPEPQAAPASTRTEIAATAMRRCRRYMSDSFRSTLGAEPNRMTRSPVVRSTERTRRWAPAPSHPPALARWWTASGYGPVNSRGEDSHAP